MRVEIRHRRAETEQPDGGETGEEIQRSSGDHDAVERFGDDVCGNRGGHGENDGMELRDDGGVGGEDAGAEVTARGETGGTGGGGEQTELEQDHRHLTCVRLRGRDYVLGHERLPGLHQRIAAEDGEGEERRRDSVRRGDSDTERVCLEDLRGINSQQRCDQKRDRAEERHSRRHLRLGGNHRSKKRTRTVAKILPRWKL